MSTAGRISSNTDTAKSASKRTVPLPLSASEPPPVMPKLIPTLAEQIISPFSYLAAYPPQPFDAAEDVTAEDICQPCGIRIYLPLLIHLIECREKTVNQ